MLYALFYAIIRRGLRMNVISSDTEAGVLVLRHELAGPSAITSVPIA